MNFSTQRHLEYLGRSSLTSQWFIVHQGVIDEDFKRKTDIMAYIKKDMQFKAGDRIAQVLLLPYVKVKAMPIEIKNKMICKY